MTRNERTRVSRRTVVRSLGAAGVAGTTGLAGCLDEGADGTEADTGVDFETVQFAVVDPYSGSFADLGEERRNGTELAIEQINDSEVYDFEIEYETYDSESDVETARQAAETAIEDDGAQYVTGCISSEVALAMNDVALENEVIYTPGAAAVPITGEACNEYVFRFETSTAQVAETMARWTERELGDRIFYQIADYDYGESVREEFERRMESLSSTYRRVGETRSPFGTTEFGDEIEQIMAAREEVDALVVGKTGGDLVAFLEQAAAAGLTDEIPIVTSTGSFAVVRAGAGEAAYGVYSGTRYIPDLETGDNQAFVEAYQDEYGELPDNFSRVGYESIRMIATGIQTAGTRDPTQVTDVLNGLEQHTIFGTTEFRECDGQSVNPVWMGEMVEPNAGEMADVELLDEVDGRVAIPNCEETGCTR